MSISRNSSTSSFDRYSVEREMKLPETSASSNDLYNSENEELLVNEPKKYFDLSSASEKSSLMAERFLQPENPSNFLRAESQSSFLNSNSDSSSDMSEIMEEIILESFETIPFLTELSDLTTTILNAPSSIWNATAAYTASAAGRALGNLTANFLSGAKEGFNEAGHSTGQTVRNVASSLADGLLDRPLGTTAESFKDTSKKEPFDQTIYQLGTQVRQEGLAIAENFGRGLVGLQPLKKTNKQNKKILPLTCQNVSLLNSSSSSFKYPTSPAQPRNIQDNFLIQDDERSESLAEYVSPIQTQVNKDAHTASSSQEGSSAEDGEEDQLRSERKNSTLDYILDNDFLRNAFLYHLTSYLELPNLTIKELSKLKLNEIVKALEQYNTNRNENKITINSLLCGQDENGSQHTNPISIHLSFLLGSFKINSANLDVSSKYTKNKLQEIGNVIGATQNHGQIDYNAQIQELKTQISINTAARSSVILANRFILNNSLTDLEISQIINQRREDGNYINNVQREFYAKILNHPFYIRWPAKLIFLTVQHSTSFAVRRFVTGLLSKIDSSGQMRNPLEARRQHTKIINSMSSFFENLNTVYTQIQKGKDDAQDEYSKDVDDLTERGLGRPIFNGGMSNEEIYRDATIKAVEELFPPLGWTEAVSNMNHPTLKFFAYPLTYLAEGVCNYIIKKFLCFILPHSQIVDYLIDSSLVNISRNGYTHSINKVMHDLLMQIYDDLDKPISKEEANSISVANKEDLKKFVKNLYASLKKTAEFQTIQMEQNPLDQSMKAFEAIIFNYGADALGLIIDKAKNTLLNPDLIPIREIALLEAINQSLVSTEVPTEDEMNELEKKLETLRESTLKRAISTVITSKFSDPTIAKQQSFDYFKNMMIKDIERISARLRKHYLSMEDANFRATLRESSNIILRYQKQMEDHHKDHANDFACYFIDPIRRSIEKIFRDYRYQNQHEDIISPLDNLLDDLKEVSIDMVNIQLSSGINDQVEEGITYLATDNAKNHFDALWSLVRKPYFWRYGVINKVLIPFIKSK